MADSNLTIAPLPGADPKLFARFMGYVKVTDGCWLWTGTTDKDGYGLISISTDKRARKGRTHRVAFEMFLGSIGKGKCVCHTCDVKPCVNPSHLWVGTNTENTADRVAKGRSAAGDANGSRAHIEAMPRGESHCFSKLTDPQVMEIRARAAAGESCPSIAKSFNMDRTTIWDIVKRKHWRHVP